MECTNALLKETNYMLTYSNILQDTLFNGGGTYNQSLSGRAELPATGYMVGVQKVAQIEYTDECQNDIIKALDSARDLVKGTDNYIGTWLDDGILYIDIAERIPVRDYAIKACKDRNERAFFDLGLGKSVDIKGLTFEYEIKVDTENHGRIEINRAIRLEELYEPSDYTLEKHHVGSHYEILADFTDLDSAERVLQELNALNV